MDQSSAPTITWRSSPSRLSLAQLNDTAQALEGLAQGASGPSPSAGSALQREAAALRALVDDLSLHLRYQALLATMSNRLLNTPLDDIEDGITSALAELGSIAQVQRVYAFLLSEDGGYLAEAYEWVAEGVAGHDFDAFRGTPVTAFPWSMEQFRRGETVFVDDPQGLPPEAAPERGACEMLDIVSYVNMPLFAAGQLIGWLGYDSVTLPRTWSEEELRFMVIAADTMVNAIERKRREERLFRQRELAQRATSVGTLAAGLAHEINNPLAFVVGNLSYIRDLANEGAGGFNRSELEDVKEAVAHAYEGAERVRRIVADMRALAFGEQTELGSVDLVVALDSTLRMVSNQLRHRATVVRDYDTAPAVRANASQLGQVLVNLVLNAAQSIPEGQAGSNRIEISTAMVAGSVQLQIADTGVGIPDETLPRVFDPFFTTRDVDEGTGLGLAICHHLVKSFGGTIDISSKVGNGTNVLVTLPLATEADLAAEHKEIAHGRASNARRILLVDDEPLVHRLLARTLKGHDVVSAHSGRDALAEIERAPDFDIIFCDLMMPEVTGQDVYHHVHEHYPDLAARMVFVTGGSFTREMANFLDALPNITLTKPFDTQTIRQVLIDIPPIARAG